MCEAAVGTYNIGSESGHSIKYWAELISNHFNVPLLIQNDKGSIESSYFSPPEFRIPAGPNEDAPVTSLLEAWYSWIETNFKKSDFS
jgi:hypothetical protein